MRSGLPAGRPGAAAAEAHFSIARKLTAVARGPSTFKQQDVTRAIRAARAAGIEVQRIEIEIDPGKIVVVAGKPTEPDIEDTTPNEWDGAT